MATELANQNFESWKRLVGLDVSFPRLRPLENPGIFERLFLQCPRHLRALDDLKYRMLNPRLAVLVNRGQGCTTFFRFALNEASRDPFRTRVIPIPLQLDASFWEGSETRQLDFEYDIKLGIFQSIINPQWAKALDRKDHLELVNAYGREEQLTNYLIALDKQVGHSLRRGEKTDPRPEDRLDWQRLRVEHGAPDFTRKIVDILDDLHRFGFRPILFIDTSWDRRALAEKQRRKKIRALATELKNCFDLGIFKLGRLNHIMFTDRDTFDRIKNSAALSFDYDQIEFAPYTSTELFGILNKQFSWVMDQSYSALPKIGDLRSDQLPLTAILDDDFISWRFNEHDGINEAVDRMREAILETLDIPWDRVPYRLHRDLHRDLGSRP